MLLYCLPAAKLDDERVAKLIEAVTPTSDWGRPSGEVEEFRDAIAEYRSWGENRHRDVTEWWIRGETRCRYYMTGGLSWGDHPTDASAHFDILSSADAIWCLLKTWAEYDYSIDAPLFTLTGDQMELYTASTEPLMQKACEVAIKAINGAMTRAWWAYVDGLDVGEAWLKHVDPVLAEHAGAGASDSEPRHHTLHYLEGGPHAAEA
jgi:hypothetical protein